MIVKAAPIIHARTKDVDFRANLLIVPDDFSASDVKWARKYIVDSTRYFELTNNYGRHIVFCNETIIVVGVSIRIEDLYKICGRETPEYARVDLQRTNYAFVGFVLKKDTLKGAVDIPYTAFLEQYEKYMNLRWNDHLGVPASLENTKVAFQDFNFKDAAFDENIAHHMSGTTNYVVDSTITSSSAFVIHAIYAGLRKSKFAFCSNIPTANWVLESDFDVVTSENAKSINETIKNKSKRSGTTIKDGQSHSVEYKKDGKQTDIDFIKGLSIKGNPKDRKDEKRNHLPLVAGLLILAAIIVVVGVIVLANK